MYLEHTEWPLPTHPGCFCIITANAVICSKIMKSIMEVWLATKTCSMKEKLKLLLNNIHTLMDMWIRTNNMATSIYIRQTCFGRLLGLGPWYLTTPVHDATKKLHIISTKHLWKKWAIYSTLNLIHRKSEHSSCYPSKGKTESKWEVMYNICHDKQELENNMSCALHCIQHPFNT